MGEAILESVMSRVDKSGNRVRKMFAEIAPRYDLMNHLLSLNIDRWWRSTAIRTLRLDGAETVLDVCTGTGDLAIAIAKRLGGKSAVMGTDFCPEMLAIARKKQERLGIAPENLHFVEADTQSLPIETDSCQAVTVAFGIRNVSDTDQGIQEMIRVLRPGGQFLILEFSKPTLPILKQLYGMYSHFVLPKLGQTIAKNSESAYEYLPASVEEFPSGKEMVSRLEKLGLRSVQARSLTFGIASIYSGVK